MRLSLFLLLFSGLVFFSCSAKKPVQRPENQLTDDARALSEVKVPDENGSPESTAAEGETAGESTDEGTEISDSIDYFDHEKELQRSMNDGTSGAVQFDIPMVMNEKVEWWVNHFVTGGSKFFRAWLERSEKYIPMMKKILRENGLPEDLIYLAMIESGFKPYAYSRAKAVGPWQFMARTGKRYGLKADWCIDERRDPEKSTIAAAQHLKDLHDEFEHWYLAAAGYNAGAGKIKRAIEKYSTEDFWEMSKHRYLRRETKDYVPKMIAAAMIAKSPEKYGFTNLNYQEPLEYDKVVVSKPTDLKSIAEAVGTTYEDLKSLNPDLLRWFTPPDYPNYELKVPKGTAELFASNQGSLKIVLVSSTVPHRLRRGDTLSQIAHSYGVGINEILAFNEIKNPRRLKPGQTIYVPVRPGAHPRLYASAERAPQKIDSETYKKLIKDDGAIGYSVRSGDTLWSISRAFNITVGEIRKWNKLGSSRTIYPGNKLVIYPRFLNMHGNKAVASKKPKLASKEKNSRYHKVGKGETLWGIAKSYNVPVNRLISLNKLSGKDIRAGEVIKIMN